MKRWRIGLLGALVLAPLAFAAPKADDTRKMDRLRMLAPSFKKYSTCPTIYRKTYWTRRVVWLYFLQCSRLPLSQVGLWPRRNGMSHRKRFHRTLASCNVRSGRW